MNTQQKTEITSLRVQDLFYGNKETTTVLHEGDIASHLKTQAKPLTAMELQQDFDYFMAQEAADQLLSAGLISLAEFNKLTQINRDTFSPMFAEIMPKIT